MAERHSSNQEVQICYGLNDIYAQITKKPFEQPGKQIGVNTLGRKQIETFGHVLPGSGRSNLTDMDFSLEFWKVEDESILGARLLRTKLSGARLGVNQVIAVLHTDANAFMLSSVRWVHVTQSGQLHAGVRYMPSVPQAIALKPIEASKGTSGKYVAALLLPAVPALKIPASLIIPLNLFQPDLVVEVVNMDNEKMELQMGFSVEKGLDYERVSYMPL